MLRRPVRSAPASGFTLIELMVTLTLFAILVTISLPSFVLWIRNAQVRSVADSLATGLRTAQAESVRRNRQVVIAFTNSSPTTTSPTNPYSSATAVAGGKRWWLQTVPQAAETTSDVAYVTAGVIVDGASAVGVVNDQSANALCFNSNGRLATNTNITGLSSGSCTAAKTTFTISQTGSDRPLKLVVQLGGQIRMCDPNRPALSASAPDGC